MEVIFQTFFPDSSVSSGEDTGAEGNDLTTLNRQMASLVYVHLPEKHGKLVLPIPV